MPGRASTSLEGLVKAGIYAQLLASKCMEEAGQTSGRTPRERRVCEEGDLRDLINVAEGIVGADTMQRLLDGVLGVDLSEGTDLRAVAKRNVASLLSDWSFPCYPEYCSDGDVRVDALRRLAPPGGFVLAYAVELESRGLVDAAQGPLYPVFEVGVAWDRLRDSPVIPASSVKGAVRAALLRWCLTRPGGRDKRVDCVGLVYRLLGRAVELQREEERVLRGVLGEDGLGEVRRAAAPGASCLVFTDLVLAGCRREDCAEEGAGGECGACRVFEPAVLTPHYSTLRRRLESEYDAGPVPVVHVVLRPGLRFRGCIATAPWCPEAPELLERLARYVSGRDKPSGYEVVAWLARVAGETGVGARTSRGYSRLRLVEAKYYARTRGAGGP